MSGTNTLVYLFKLVITNVISLIILGPKGQEPALEWTERCSNRVVYGVELGWNDMPMTNTSTYPNS